jgi:hypothetical protein
VKSLEAFVVKDFYWIQTPFLTFPHGGRNYFYIPHSGIEREYYFPGFR